MINIHFGPELYSCKNKFSYRINIDFIKNLITVFLVTVCLIVCYIDMIIIRFIPLVSVRARWRMPGSRFIYNIALGILASSSSSSKSTTFSHNNFHNFLCAWFLVDACGYWSNMHQNIILWRVYKTELELCWNVTFSHNSNATKLIWFIIFRWHFCSRVSFFFLFMQVNANLVIYQNTEVTSSDIFMFIKMPSILPKLTRIHVCTQNAFNVEKRNWDEMNRDMLDMLFISLNQRYEEIPWHYTNSHVSNLYLNNSVAIMSQMSILSVILTRMMYGMFL